MSALAKVNSWQMMPTSLAEMMTFCEMIANSTLVPKDYQNKPGNCLIAIQMGAEVGLSAMQAIQGIAVINGRPAMWGDALLALVQAHPDFVDIIEVDDGNVATCTLKLKGREPTVRTFSKDDVARAGLGGVHKQYPARMRQMRARGFALRDGAAYILRGMGSAEEAQDMPARELRASATMVEEPKAPEAPAPAQLPPPAATKPLPTKTAKNYQEKQWAEVPFASLPASALIDYIAYYRERLPTLTQANHRNAVELTLAAAEAEGHRRLEAEGLGADPETGELPQADDFPFESDGAPA